MATTGIMGPFERSDPLGPQEARWVDLGTSDGYGKCAISVTASPHQGIGGTAHVLKVDNVNITGVQTNEGDIVGVSYSAGCNVTNNGDTTIEQWSVVVGVIAP